MIGITLPDPHLSPELTTYPLPFTKEIPNTGSHSYTSNSEQKPSIWQKIWDIAQNIFNAAVGIIFYWTNPSLFAVGFIAGIIFDDHVADVIRKIKNIWNTQPLSFSFLGGFASFLSLPVTLATSSILWAANLGSMMSRKSFGYN